MYGPITRHTYTLPSISGYKRVLKTTANAPPVVKPATFPRPPKVPSAKRGPNKTKPDHPRVHQQPSSSTREESPQRSRSRDSSSSSSSVAHGSTLGITHVRKPNPALQGTGVVAQRRDKSPPSKHKAKVRRSLNLTTSSHSQSSVQTPVAQAPEDTSHAHPSESHKSLIKSQEEADEASCDDDLFTQTPPQTSLDIL